MPFDGSKKLGPPIWHCHQILKKIVAYHLFGLHSRRNI
jgi:hypothetical protein